MINCIRYIVGVQNMLNETYQIYIDNCYLYDKRGTTEYQEVQKNDFTSGPFTHSYIRFHYE